MTYHFCPASHALFNSPPAVALWKPSDTSTCPHHRGGSQGIISPGCQLEKYWCTRMPKKNVQSKWGWWIWFLIASKNWHGIVAKIIRSTKKSIDINPLINKSAWIFVGSDGNHFCPRLTAATLAHHHGVHPMVSLNQTKVQTATSWRGFKMVKMYYFKCLTNWVWFGSNSPIFTLKNPQLHVKTTRSEQKVLQH